MDTEPASGSRPGPPLSDPRRQHAVDPADLLGAGRRLVANLTKNWWVLLVRGVAAIAFGVLAWFWPGLSIVTLILLFGVFALADGVLALWGAISGPKENEHRWLLALWGLVGVLVGAISFLAPGITAVSLLIIIAVWAIAKGVLEIATAIRLRKEIEGEWILIVGGLASVAFGLVLVFRPGVGALAVIWLIGTYAVLFGLLLTLLAFKVRSWGKRLSAPLPATGRG